MVNISRRRPSMNAMAGTMTGCPAACKGLSHNLAVLPRRAARRSGLCRQPMRINALFGKGDGKGGGNPFANMGNLMENVKKAQQLVQVEAAKVQEELAKAEFDGYCADETVRVVMSGNQEPRSVDITEAAMEGNSAEELSGLVIEAMRDAHAKSVEGMKARMSTLASSLGLGGQNPLGPGS